MKPRAECLERGHDRLSGVLRSVSEDVSRYLTKSAHDIARGDTPIKRLSALLTPDVFPILLYRMAHYLEVKGWPRTATTVTRINGLLHRVNITPQSCIGAGLRLPHPAGVTFHGRAGTWLTVYSQGICCPRPDAWGCGLERAPILGDRVTLGGHAAVQGGISVGEGTLVAYEAHLSEDVPANSLVFCSTLRMTYRRRPEPGATDAN